MNQDINWENLIKEALEKSADEIPESVAFFEEFMDRLYQLKISLAQREGITMRELESRLGQVKSRFAEKLREILWERLPAAERTEEKVEKLLKELLKSV